MSKDNFEWGFDKVEFKVNLKDEINTQEYKRFIIPFIFVVTVIGALFMQSWMIFFAGMFFVILFSVAICLCESWDKVKEKTDCHFAEQRTESIYATIIKIEYEPEADYDYVRIIAKYEFDNGKIQTFKSKKVIGKAICEIGNTIEILIDPNNHSNYVVNISECIV